MSKIKINIWILATLLALLTACRDEAGDTGCRRHPNRSGLSPKTHNSG